MLGGGHTKELLVKGQETGVAGVASQQQRLGRSPGALRTPVWAGGCAQGLRARPQP